MAEAPVESAPDVPEREIDHLRYDAIHRALLAGLLGNIGQKSEVHEYTGARGRKFHVFPGSGLFSRKPPWVMAAELTETTRLYALTVARIDPLWVEQVGRHVVKREYSEPHWVRQSGHVMAYERVTLWGLVLVARRRVHYGPIDPKTSREIFIRQALVEMEYNSDAPWIRNNRRLLRDVELLEAKLRRRDVLTDAQSRFAFFDPKIPAGIYNAPLFEKWRRQAEETDRQVLVMSQADLVVPGPIAPPDQFPDAMTLGEVRIPLAYRFEPGHAADGVTAGIPLALLNQIDATPFEWLVPGWLAEKIVALIKTLPRELRTAFVPAPDTARAVAPMLKFGEGDMLDALAWHLGRMTGVNVPRSAWEPAALPEWLRMNFSVVDESGQPIASGRDLDELRRQLKVELKRTFAEMQTSEWHRDKLTSWDFGDLPEQVEVKRPGMTVKGFPALLDQGEAGVGLRLLDTPEAARIATRAGVRRLFTIQLGQEMKYLARNLPGIDRMCLHYATVRANPAERGATPVAVRPDPARQASAGGTPAPQTVQAPRARQSDAGGTPAPQAPRSRQGAQTPQAPPSSCDELRRDLVDVIVDRALFDDEAADIRTRDAFAARAETGWRRLSAASQEVCALIDEVLVAHHALATRLAGAFPPLLEGSIRDMREQIGHLVHRGFVVQTPFAWLRHVPRFLKGIDVRLRKLQSAGATRDLAGLAEVRPLWEQYLRRADLHRHQGIVDPALTQFRWMIEELRVSLFAQELKTSVPVSVKRLQAVWAEVK